MQSNVSALGSASEHVAGTADVDNASLQALTNARQLVVDAAEHLQVRYLHPFSYLKWSPEWVMMQQHWKPPCICSAV